MTIDHASLGKRSRGDAFLHDDKMFVIKENKTHIPVLQLLTRNGRSQNPGTFTRRRRL